ncbi:restriction endonuclease subunit S [Arcticibacter eurypsychrophilus]|uniref:restriction endonuclease subunit S n=1 Tax=Arcticibacter eurypsychrophilus TaxID=1434752 RepID=UPI00084DD9AB|nr:restriction endonuclease subunit S [Arcticibacter eurypsychrophilus]
MSYIEKLLENVEVEWKPISNALIRTKGTKITAEHMKTLHSNQAPLKIFAGGKTVAFVDFKDIPEKDINREPSIIVKSRGVIEFEYFDKPFSHKNEMWSYHSIDKFLDIKFVYYFLKINEPYFQNIGSRMQMPQISTPDTEKFKIPIPCPGDHEKSLQIQKEIIRILDAFTELTAELTTELIAELIARKKQYSYYRDQLLNFEDGQSRQIEWKSLSEVATIGTGSRNTNESIIGGKYPFFVRSQEPRTINEYEFDETAIITAGDGVGVGKVFHHMIGKYALHQRAYRIVITDKLVSSKYLFHFIRNNFAKYLETTSVHASVTSLRRPMFERYQVPIPSMDEQERIVSILDKFDTLTTSISEALPKEIKLRQKQYEYYRDILLTFPKDNLTA